MNIKLASQEEIEIVLHIVHNTVNSIYPNYYPYEVADFFIKHHSLESIKKDIEKGSVYLIMDNDSYVGTGTREGRYIGRVYILPEFQGKGYGAAIVNFIESEIFKEHTSAYLEASLPSYSFYLKNGYKPIEYHRFNVDNNRVLCYYVMEKELGKPYEVPVIIVD